MFRKSRVQLLPLLVTLAVMLFSVTASAQQDLGQFDGVVSDAAGKPISGATLKLTSRSLGVERTTIASEKGEFSFAHLRPSIYAITIHAKGYYKAQLTDLFLGVGQVRTFDLRLAAGDENTLVNIAPNDAPPMIDTKSNRLGVNVTSSEVLSLPINGRNYSQLQLLAPGAINTGSGNFNELRFNGRSNQQNGIRLDGVEASAIWDASPGYLTVQGSQFRLQTSLENIQEFRVDSSNYPVEYGTGTGAQINVVLRGGTNEFHGAAFHYARNDLFDARNFFNGADKSKLRLNQYGGSFGGRIIANRLFFFGSYEGLRQRAGTEIIELTPSATARDFINFAGTNDPRGVAAATALGLNPTAADLTRIAALRATGAVNAFPVGAGPALSLGGVPNAAQFIQSNLVTTLNEDAWSVRLDGKISERFSGFARFQRSKGNLLTPDGTTGRTLLAQQQPENMVGSLTQLYSSRVVNETKFGFNRPPTELSAAFPTVAGSALDFSRSAINLSGSIVQPGINGGAPTGIVSPGGLTRQSSAGNGRAQMIHPRSFNFIDNLTLTRGAQQLKFGGEVRLLQASFDQLGGFQYTYGSFRDFLLNQNLTGSYIGDLSEAGGFSVLTNPITTLKREAKGEHQAQQHYFIWYAQDEWKLRPNLTLNAGLRYEYYSPVREQDARAIAVDARTGQFLDPSKPYYRASKNGWGPRLALAWAPAIFYGKTIVRVGGGLYYGPGQFEDLIQPIESDVFRGSRTLNDGLTAAAPAALVDRSQPISGFTPRVYDTRGYVVPERVGQYGLSIQQQLPKDIVLTVAYVGSQGRNLFQRGIANTILPGVTTIAAGAALPSGFGVVNETNAAGQVVRVTTVRQFDLLNKAYNSATGAIVDSTGAILRPFGEMDYKTSGGRDSFNALQLTVNRRFTQGLTLGGHYQWSHSIGTTQGSNEANTTQDSFNFNGERGNNTFDIRHSVNLSALYEVPVGGGKWLNISGWKDKAFGNWLIGGMYNGRSGLPLDIRITRGDMALLNPTTGEVRRFTAPSSAQPLPNGFIAVVNTPGGGASRNTRRPDLVSGVNPFLNLGDGNLRYLNPAAFAIPKAGSYGNLARNALYGPGFQQFDLTLQKKFRLTERLNFEFRTEIYNLFNHANFSNPPTALSDNLGAQQPGQPFSASNAGNFGVINATVGRAGGLGTNRQLQFSGRIAF
jgi:hypothetical protein